jgi:hypothetical protein
MSRGSSFGIILLQGLALALPACEEKKTAEPAEHRANDGGAATPPGVDRNLAEAIVAVAGGQGQDSKGPPESGVFAPGAADRELRAGEMPKLTLGSAGTGDTVRFASSPKVTKKLDGTVVVSVQTGPRSALPTISYSLSFEPETAKAEPAATSPVVVNGKVTAAKLAQEQPGELPPGLDKQIAKAKGSKLDYAFAPTGSGRQVSVEPATEMDESLAMPLRSAGDALAVAFQPYPTEPVGVGAFWMVTSREAFVGLDVVVYRMIKLEKIEGDVATLNVSAKRFVASGGKIGLPGIPPHHIADFSGNTNGRIQVSVSNPLNVHGELQDALIAGLVPEGAPPQGLPPGQKMQVHLEMRSELAFGK